MNIRVIGRKKMKTLKGRPLLAGVAGVVAAGVLIRLFTLSGPGGTLESWMLRAGENAGLVTSVLDMEFKGLPGGEEGLVGTLKAQSAFLASLGAPRPVSAPAPGAAATPGAGGPDELQNENTALLDVDDFMPPGLVTGPSEAGTPTPSAAPSAAPLPDNIREITFNPTSSDGYDAAQGVYVKNETSLKIDVSSLLSKTPPVRLAAEGPQILIVHTHGSEAFLPDAEYPYMPTDIERTEDTEFNVVRVGDEVQKIFEAQGLRVLHDRNIYDEPTYNGSYGRSLASIEKYIKDYPSISVVIDLHRDSIQSKDGMTYKTVAIANGQKIAQAMLVIGTNDSGLDHPNWKQNLTFAVHLQQLLNKAHPGMMRPIDLRKERFNEHATTGSILLEVGSSGNTLGEAITTAQCVAEVMGEYLKELTVDS